MSLNQWKAKGTQGKSAAIDVPVGEPLALVIWTATMGLLVFATLIGALHAAERGPFGGAVAGTFSSSEGQNQLVVPNLRVGSNGWIQSPSAQKLADCTVQSVDSRAVDLQCRGVGPVAGLFTSRATLLLSGGPGQKGLERSAKIQFGSWLSGYRTFPFRLSTDLLAPLGLAKPRRVAMRAP